MDFYDSLSDDGAHYTMKNYLRVLCEEVKVTKSKAKKGRDEVCVGACMAVCVAAALTESQSARAWAQWHRMWIGLEL